MNFKRAAAAALACMMLFASFSQAGAAADRTSKYRVYQNENALMEFSDRNAAIAYAKQFSHAYVEQIGTRTWIWHSFPKYKVYQNGKSQPSWEFDTLDQAIAEAKRWANASVRELGGGGWVWDNYPQHPGYTLYQGDKTLPGWTFATLKEAQTEAKKWANAHIIDNATNRWVWDNIPAERKEELRSGPEKYRVYQNGKTLDQWGFADLESAKAESIKWADSVVIRTDNEQVVFANRHDYILYQNGNRKSSFVSLRPAIEAASRLENASIVLNSRTIWSNEGYYAVYQTGKKLSSFPDPAQAAAYAAGFENSEVITLDGLRIWDNRRGLLYLARNGTAKHDTIMSHAANTQGLDIDSPTWFILQDAKGTLKDESNAETVRMLQRQGIQVHPLVHNQFNSKLTSAFLADKEAQQRFIAALVERLKAIGADGVNIDFESMAGSDRDRYTEFVRKLSEAAHAAGLTVSIDLPRGSVLWNHQTAFDHEKLHAYVDYVIIMAYDQFYSGSASPGPVSGLGWAEQGVEEFLSYGIPRSKLMLGVPFYIRLWEVDANGKLLSNRAVFMSQAEALLKDATELSVASDPQYGLDKVQFAKDGKRYVFWMENVATALKRVDIAKKHDLAGIAAWRLGYEPAELWTELLRVK